MSCKPRSWARSCTANSASVGVQDHCKRIMRAIRNKRSFADDITASRTSCGLVHALLAERFECEVNRRVAEVDLIDEPTDDCMP